MGVSLNHRATDSVAQGPIGPMAEGGGIRAHDGFFLVLPGINVPVEGSFLAALTESETVVLRWSVGSLSEVAGFNVYRATSESGPFVRLNAEILPPESPAWFEDSTVWPETTFWYQLRAVLADGTEEAVSGAVASVATGGRLAVRLEPPHPNPCTGTTTFQLEVPGGVGPARLVVYNVRGQEVTRLVDGTMERGRPVVAWDGCDEQGRSVSSGVYLVRFEIGDEIRTQKVLVVR
jgi:hypothetical protein